MYYRSTEHIMSTNTPSILSSGSDAWRYAPRKSSVSTTLPLRESIINDSNNAYSTLVGDIDSSRGIYFCRGLPYSHVLPLTLPHHFSLMIFMSWNDLYFSYRDMSAGYCGTKKVRLFNCMYLLSIDTTAAFKYIWIPFWTPYG